MGSIGRLAKWAVDIDTAARAEALINEAVRHAVAARPGPVVVTVPEEVLDELVPGAPGDAAPFRPIRVEPEPDDVRTVLQLLAAARRPVIVAGAGVLRSRGTADLVRLAELLEVPVIASWRRGDVFPNDHRLYLGMTGYGAAPTVADRLEAADAILVLGCRLSEVATFGYAMPRSDVPWAHVDVEPRSAHAGLSAPTHAVPADARTFLRVARRRVSSGVLDAAAYDARRDANEADRQRRRRGALGRRRGPSGPVDRHPERGPPAAGDRHHRCRQLLRLGRSRLPVPTAGHVARPDVRRDGLRAAGGDRRVDRASRPAGGGARR